MRSCATAGAAATAVLLRCKRYCTRDVRSADLVKDGFNNFAVGARQDLAKNGAGDLDIERLAFRPI